MNDSLRDELKSRAAAAVHYLDDYGKVDTTISSAPMYRRR